jgi:cbb3-type cytochrome oxidase subunit 3
MCCRSKIAGGPIMVLSFIGASGGTETVPRMMHIACDGAWEKDAMLAKILFAWCLVAMTVFFHAAAPAIVLNPVLRLTAQLETRFWPMTWLVVRITWWLIVIHVVEIAVWALFFWWQKCLPDAESSFYFRLANGLNNRTDPGRSDQRRI